MTDPIRAKPSSTHYVTARGDKVTVTTYLPREMFERLEVHARASGTTKAALLRALVEKYLAGLQNSERT